MTNIDDNASHPAYPALPRVVGCGTIPLSGVGAFWFVLELSVASAAYFGPGVAGAFTFWNPQFHCPTFSECHFIFQLWVNLLHAPAPDSEGVCHLLNLYILVASWIIPVLRACLLGLYSLETLIIEQL